jgi:hypothetical protein
MEDLLKKNRLKTASLTMPTYQLPSIEDMVDMKEMERLVDEMNQERTEKEAKEEAYKEEHLRLLKNIEQNTKGLDNIVSLLANITKQQDEVLEILKECLAISASAGKQEAESKYRHVMNKVNTVVEDFGTMQTLQGFANTVYQLFINTLG